MALEWNGALTLAIVVSTGAAIVGIRIFTNGAKDDSSVLDEVEEVAMPDLVGSESQLPDPD